MLTIGFFGDGPWARRTLERLASTDAVEVRFIAGRHPVPDPALCRMAEARGVPFLSFPDANASDVVRRIEAFGADLHVSMSFDQIIRAPLRATAPRGFINCHAGALPFYRGRNVLNWALINGEERFGVTVHVVDDGIDTGPILDQRFAPIAPSDTYASVHARAVELCAEALDETLRRMAEGPVETQAQADIHPVGFYTSRRGPGDEWIDWAWPSRRIVNFVRALAPPGPGAWTGRPEAPIAVLEAERIPGAPAYLDRPGTVVGRDEGGVTVKTGDTTVRVVRVADRTAGGGLAEARTARMPIGTRLASDPREEVRVLRERLARLEKRLEEHLERTPEEGRRTRRTTGAATIHGGSHEPSAQSTAPKRSRGEGVPKHTRS